MNKKVIILDTSILCVWLRVPGMDKIEKDGETKVTPADVENKISAETKAGCRIVLPLASIIETGNHITQIKGDPYNYINSFANLVHDSIDGRKPWDIFRNQSVLFSDEKLKELVDDWKKYGRQKLSIGDTSIKQVAEYYFDQGLEVEIYTGDSGLKAFEPRREAVKLPRNKGRR